MRVADIIGQLHLFAPVEYGLRILDNLRIQTVGHFIAVPLDMEPSRAIGGIDLGEDGIEIEVVEMLGAAANLTQQFSPPDDFIKRTEAKLCQYLAHFLGNESHQVDDFFRRTGEFCAQFLILHTNAYWTGV